VVSIPGNPPRLDRPLVGCPFAPRCPKAMEICRTEAPGAVSLGDGHVAACHLNTRAREVTA